MGNGGRDREGRLSSDIDWNRFHFKKLDFAIENVVLPMKQELAANGETLYVNLNYVDFGSSSFEHYRNADKYAEFILATFIHMRDTYGFVPDGVAVILEPDNTDGWSANEIGQAIAATGNQLEANGFAVPDFIAPSNLSMSLAVDYFDQIIEVPGALDYLDELSYHWYSGVSDSNLWAIASRGVQQGIKTGMLEHIGSGYEHLHQDLKLGRVSGWQQFTLAYPIIRSPGLHKP